MKTIAQFIDLNGISSHMERLRHELVWLLEARDAEHRAELAAAQRTIEKLAEDAAALNDQLITTRRMGDESRSRALDLAAERTALLEDNSELYGALQISREGIQAYCDSENAMRSELAEATSILRAWAWFAGEDKKYEITGERTRAFLAAPPPAESTPVQPAKAHETNYGREAQLPSPNTDGRIGTKARDTSDAEGKAKVAGESPAAPSIHVHGNAGTVQPAPQPAPSGDEAKVRESDAVDIAKRHWDAIFAAGGDQLDYATLDDACVEAYAAGLRDAALLVEFADLFWHSGDPRTRIATELRKRAACAIARRGSEGT